jgi:hypothetical protein
MRMDGVVGGLGGGDGDGDGDDVLVLLLLMRRGSTCGSCSSCVHALELR